jgi:hypothetical protein
MMSKKQLTEAHALMASIESTTNLVDRYEDADKVSVRLSTPTSMRAAYEAEVTLTADEIGEAIVTALRARIEAMKKRLAELGVEWVDEKKEAEDHPLRPGYVSIKLEPVR